MKTGSRIRLMTYNVHGCIGTDRRLLPLRIAAVIEEQEPDIVALQELDVCRPRTGRVDQARLIADHLEMDVHFHPAWQVEEEQFGDAILSRLPMRLVHKGSLRTAKPKRWERRGALWAAIRAGEHEIQFLNTHLGLQPVERQRQAELLFGEDWLNHPHCRSPRILCGDFNARPSSRVHRRFEQSLRNAYRCLAGARKSRRTFPTPYPVVSIDHIFVSEEFEVHRVDVVRSPTAREASDHFPLLAEVSLP